MNKSKQEKSTGFSLLELLVVITIIMILAVIGLVAFGKITAKTRDLRRKSDLAAIQTAIEMYFSATNTYPGPGNCGHNTPSWINWSNCNEGNWDSSGTDIVAVLETGGYIKKMPVDPKNSGGPSETEVNPENYTYGYRAWTGNDATYYLCANLETETDTTGYAGYNYCLRGGCVTCH